MLHSSIIWCSHRSTCCDECSCCSFADWSCSALVGYVVADFNWSAAADEKATIVMEFLRD